MLVFARAGLLVPAKRIRNTVDIVFTLRKGFIAAISVIAIVAGLLGRVLVAVDVDDGRADGNGYEDEEPREAAYRPRFRHPRDDGGRTPYAKRLIIVAAADLLSFSNPARVDGDCPDRSKAAASRFRLSNRLFV